MKPNKQEHSDVDDLFQMLLEQLLDQRNALYRLARQMNWEMAEIRLGGLYAEVGRHGLPNRLMVGLHYLKHAFNERDETVVARWVENPYWQYFFGERYFRHEMPIDPNHCCQNLRLCNSNLTFKTSMQGKARINKQYFVTVT